MNKQMKKTLIIFITILIIMLIVANLPYLIHFHDGFSNDSGEYANYGSYIGGTLGGAFSLISILLLVVSLSEQREFTNKQIKILQKQINDTREDNEKIHIFNILDKEIEKLNRLLFSKLEPEDLFIFVKKNGEEVYNQYYKKIEGSSSFKSIVESGEKEFIERNKNNSNQIYINFINSLRISKFDYSSIIIPVNINSKTNRIVLILADIYFLINEYSKHIISHSRLVSMLKEATDIANYLSYINFSNSKINSNLYDFYSSINDYGYSSFIKYPEMYINFIEFRIGLYNYLKEDLKIISKFTENHFVYNSEFQIIESWIFYKDYSSDDWEKLIEISKVKNFI